ncbi:cytochrome P450 [Lentzea sp. NPDC059081]|uniref:cytochrome P450 n=1 Tax=Lentzea sp. NPDC059081 TaxID=3346719 RepID=UPI00367F5B87
MTNAEQQEAIPEKLAKLPVAEFSSCPGKAFSHLRSTSPAIPVESAGHRFWVISRYDDVCSVMVDPSVEMDFFKHEKTAVASSKLTPESEFPRVPRGANRSPFYQDGERHLLVRAAVKKFLFHDKEEELAAEARETAQSLLDAFQPGRTIDLMAEYANIIAAKTVCSIAGIPDNDRNMQAATLWGHSLTTPVRSKVEPAARLLVDWATELVDIKRKEPGDDVFTSILRLHDEGKISKVELTSTYIVLLSAGTQVAVTIGNGVYSFLCNPGELAKALAQPDLFTASVDEIVRYESNSRFIAPHVTTQPLHLDGVTVPAGELVLLCLGAANRDPNRFDDPDTFDITRVTTGHLGFGYARHRCAGEQLGKANVAAALRLFFERFPKTALVDPPDQVRWQPGKFQRKLESLHVIPL